MKNKKRRLEFTWGFIKYFGVGMAWEQWGKETVIVFSVPFVGGQILYRKK